MLKLIQSDQVRNSAGLSSGLSKPGIILRQRTKQKPVGFKNLYHQVTNRVGGKLKLLVLAAIIFFSARQADAQITYAVSGPTPGNLLRTSTDATTTGATKILAYNAGSTSTNVFSASQTLPFAFNFFGAPVTNYVVNKNGLLSFDAALAGTTTPASLNVNTALPEANLPSNTIAWFWGDFAPPMPSGDDIWSITYGTAPNRQHWVFTYSFKLDAISFTYNAVVLEETTNKVYVVDMYNGSSGGTFTVGVQQNATTAVQLSGSPNVAVQNTGTANTDNDYYMFDPYTQSPIDVMVTGLVSPGETGCFGPNQTVTVTIKNNGTNVLDFATNPVTISATATGANSGTIAPYVVNTGTLAVGASQNVVVTTTFDMSNAGTTTFNATASVTGDGNPGNNAMAPADRTIADYQVPATAALPQVVDFNDFTGSNLGTVFPGWREASGTTPTGSTSNWLSDDFGNVVGGTNDKAARINLDAASDNVWIISPKITATATTALKFNLALTTFGTTSIDTLGSDDQLMVMVSTDCGLTFTPVRTYSATTPISNTGQTENVNLAAYAGQNIIVAFYATEGTVNDTKDVDLFLDNIFLGTLPALDLGANVLVSPAAGGCYTASEMVTVTIENFGLNTLNFAANPATVTVNVSGAVTQLLDTTLTTGTLAAGATMNVNIGTLNMLPVGTYTFNGRTTLTGDGNTGNDSLTTATRIVNPLVSLPQVVDFTGFTGTNLVTVFPGWVEANGTTPAGTTSSWTDDDFANVTGGVNGKAANLNLNATADDEWIISPKVAATATTVLKFDLALTNDNVTTATTMGSDDALKIMVSTNCGLTFTPIRTYDATSTISNTGQAENVSLAAYAGQNIIVAFYATEGTVDDAADNDLFIDNIFLGTPPTLDLGATALVSPAAGNCYSANEMVTVTIENFGPNAHNFSVNPVTVTVNVSGAVTQVIDTTLTTGTLAVGATLNVNVGSLNMTPTGTYTFNGGTTLTGDGNPTNNNFTQVSIQNTMVSTYPYLENFDTFTTATNATGYMNGWVATPTSTTSAFRWNIDQGPTPSSGSNTGPAVDHTLGTATGKYVFTESSSGATGAIAELQSPCISLPAATPMGLEFYYHMFGAAMGTLHVDIYNGTTWIPDVIVLTGQQQTATTDTWRRAAVSLASYSGSVVKVRFRGERGTSFTSDMAIDDVRIYALPPVELAVTNVTLPSSGCGLTATENICISIVNNGGTAISNFPVSYTINGGTPVSETVAGPLVPGATLQYCFTTKANFSTPATYSVTATVAATGDADVANNTASGTTTAKATIAAFPYTEGFENGNGGWTASGTNVSWALGAPAGTVINTAGGGTNSWVTNLTGDHPSNENSFVTSPCFNFTGIPNPAISMKINFDIEDDWDGTVLQSSIDGGATWQLVGDFGDPNNWYNSDSIDANPGNQPASQNGRFVGWSGTGTAGSGGWVTARHALTGLGGQASVQLRVAFASDAFVVEEGFAFDDVNIFETVATPTITAGGATTFCSGDSLVLTAASTTTGATFQWFNNGTAITGATAATYTATASGSYTVVASVGSNPSSPSVATTVTVNATPATPTVTLNSNTLTASATTGTYQWFSVAGTTLTPISGATAATFTPTVNGSYTVVVTVNGCASDTAAATQVVLGIASMAPGMDVSVYPNPTASKFAVNLIGFEKEATIQIINVTGQVVSTERVVISTKDKTSKAFNLNGMAKGVYILKVTSGDNLTFRKVILD